MKCMPRKENEFTCLIQGFGTDQLNFAASLAQTIILVFDTIKVELFFLSVAIYQEELPLGYPPGFMIVKFCHWPKGEHSSFHFPAVKGHTPVS